MSVSIVLNDPSPERMVHGLPLIVLISESTGSMAAPVVAATVFFFLGNSPVREILFCGKVPRRVNPRLS
jgi:hypothetical protein